MAAKPRRDDRDFTRLVDDRFPGLVARVRGLIEKAEKAFGGKGGENGASFLWEHTVHVASFALRIARRERRDPLPAVLTALFHDAGKFRRGRYHAGRAPEEAAAARIARGTLRGAGAPARLVAEVAAALEALYNERRMRRPAADIVHDADFLAKAGTLGVAHFFVKSTLRGRTLSGAVATTLSKELTYAAVLPLNMRTDAGRALARTRSRETLRFFRRFLAEINEAAPPGFRLVMLRVPRTPILFGKLSRVSPEFIRVRLVVPAACDRCGGRVRRYEHNIERGVKCRELVISIKCRRCGTVSEVS
ncbi:MAG: HD domain-containing protein, partial [Candidatus Aminicenantes bacterium]|nr:HD domain-containing protein [Candidatus Aminicenantes bacterium]